MKTGTIGEFISRIRNLIKGVKQDAFLTDRFLYSLIRKHAGWLLKREDGASKLTRINSIFQTLSCVELIDVDKVQANCAGLRSGCTIKRSKETLPTILEGYFGPIVRSVTSIDGMVNLHPTLPGNYVAMSRLSSFKYNSARYYWILDGYIFLPNIDWDAVTIEAVFEEDISPMSEGDHLNCSNKQDGAFHVPEYLFGELEAQVLKDLSLMLQIPSDPNHDKLNPAAS